MNFDQAQLKHASAALLCAFCFAFSSSALSDSKPLFEEKEVAAAYEGQDIQIQGWQTVSPFGAKLMKRGTITFKGEEFQIVSASWYGNIGAISKNFSENNQRVLFFTSSFGDLVKNKTNPGLALAQSYENCIEVSFNAFAVVYDLTGIEVKLRDGKVLDTKNGIKVEEGVLKVSKQLKKELFPALMSNLENSKSSSGHCRAIEATL